MTVLALLLGAMSGGKAIRYLFGIQIAAFTSAGGIIILLIALKMVLVPPKPEVSPSEGIDDIAIVPLGTPLLIQSLSQYFTRRLQVVTLSAG